MDRRSFLLTSLAGALVARPGAEAQPPTMPVIGFLSSLVSRDRARILPAFHRGLSESGYFDGVNVAIEYRWAEGQYERLPALAAELVRRRVRVIAALSGTPAGLAAKGATATIPIVFAVGGDPVAEKLVNSLSRSNRSNSNVTGVTFFTAQLGAKRLELLRAVASNPSTIAVLVNPNNPASASEGRRVQAEAEAIRQQTRLCHATTDASIDRTFAIIRQERIGALLVTADPLFLNERNTLVPLAVRHAVPTIYADREITEVGGLISYGASRTDAYQQAGIYVGRILKGERASDLPVIEPTRFELVINLKTAKALGLTIPPSLLARADQVIQ